MVNGKWRGASLFARPPHHAYVEAAGLNERVIIRYYVDMVRFREQRYLVQALLLLNHPHLDELTFERTMGCVLKSTEDQELVRKRGLDNLLTAAVG